MPQKGLIYRVLIASPSDCVKERSSIPEIIYSWNSSHSFHTGVILEPVMWESHVIPELGGRPQEVINKQIVDSCDFLIGAFWTRIGTVTSDYASGTVEEIDRLRKKGKKTLLYFSSAPVVPDSIDPNQYKELQDYKKAVRDQGITFDYADVGQFREMLQKHLSSLMASIAKENGSIPSQEIREPESDIQMFKSQFDSFVRRLNAEWASERDSEPHNIEEAKYILTSAVGELLHFQSQIVSDPEDEILPLFQECSKDLKVLQRHRLYIDGGKSFTAFWEKGDAAIMKLRKISDVLES